MGTGTGDEAEAQEEEDADDEKYDFGSQISVGSSTQGNDAYTNGEIGSTDQFGVVRTISKTTNGSNLSGEFVNMTNSEVRPGENINTGPCNPPVDLEADHEETSRQRSKTRVSSSTKLPGTERVTPPLVTPLVDNGESSEVALTIIERERSCGKRSTATDKK